MAIEINKDTDYHASDDDFAVIAAATEQIAQSGRNAEAIFKANAALAAKEIVSLALGAMNETVRLNAAKYVVERVMGKVPDTKDLNKDGDEPWAGIYGTIVVHEPSAEERTANANQRAITGRPTPHTNAGPQSRQ